MICNGIHRCFAGLSLLAALLINAAPAEAVIPPSEREALLALFEATDGEHWQKHDGWGGPIGTECTWYGVTCSSGNTVLRLILGVNGLSGPLPSQLANLRNLEDLILPNNQLSALPEQLGELKNLKALTLHFNRFTGPLPAFIGNFTRLEYLSLGNNDFSGAVPATYWNLRNLQNLLLEGNELVGEIPAAVANLQNLTELDLESNRFSGRLPQTLGDLSQLTHLHLTSNEFSGEIPCEIGNLGNLVSLGLSKNLLTGSIPPGLGNLAGLRQLQLSDNQLGGSIPAELGALSGLEVLRLDHNRLVGPPPRSLMSLRRLTEIRLSNNALITAMEPDLRAFLDRKHPEGAAWATSQAASADIIPPAAAASGSALADPAGSGFGVVRSQNIVGLVLLLLALDNRLDNTWIYFKIRSSPLWGSRIFIRIKRRNPRPSACAPTSAVAALAEQSSGSELGNADLYIKRGSPPTQTDFDQASRNSGSDEEIVLDLQNGETYFLGVHAREAFSGLALEVEAPAVNALTCLPDETTLCLNQGRFAVEAAWFTPQGDSGPGRAHPLTSDTGYFWFFSPANTEMIVKVIDACSFADRFWVFAAGLTDVEVELTVRDMETGERRTYRNPQGVAFKPIQDTAAFRTCNPPPH